MAYDKKYLDAADFHVAVHVTYTDGSVLYADKDKKVKITPDEAMNLFFKSMVVFNLTSSTYIMLKSIKNDAGTVTLTLADDTAITIAAEE